MGIARKLRVKSPGAMDSFMNRGDHQEVIFRNLKDGQLLLEALGQTGEETSWQIHAWCLRANCFHWVVETSRGISCRR